MASTKGLVLLNPWTMKFAYLCPLPLHVTSVLADGEYLWIACVAKRKNVVRGGGSLAGCCVLCFHRPTRTWYAQINVPYAGSVDDMVLAHDVLWLGMCGAGNTLVSIDLTEIRLQQ
jgi:hypothetical protein